MKENNQTLRTVGDDAFTRGLQTYSYHSSRTESCNEHSKVYNVKKVSCKSKGLDSARSNLRYSEVFGKIMSNGLIDEMTREYIAVNRK